MQTASGQESVPATSAHGQPFLRLAQFSYLLMVSLLAWMKHPFTIERLDAFPVDALFLITTSLWLIAIVRRETVVRYHPAYWLLLAYLGAMILSLLSSDDRQQSSIKLLTQVYLLSLPLLTLNLVRTMADLKRVFAWWLAGTAAVGLLGVVTILLFPILGPESWLELFLHENTTLPPGPYFRLELTFLLPAMLANYLGTSLMLLMIGERLGWFRPQFAIALGCAIFLCALFTLTPGLGGLLFTLSVWFWYWARHKRKLLARFVLIAGCAMPLVAVILASVTVPHPTTPFLIDIPSLPTLAPAVRLLAWLDGFETFTQNALTGIGIGAPAVSVYMQTHYCTLSASCVTDAHNTFLSVAVQSGIIGLATLSAIIGYGGYHVKCARPEASEEVVVFGLAITWIAGIALQGLVGSFEDSRHLWLVFGLILSAKSVGQAPTFGHWQQGPPASSAPHTRIG